MKPLLTPDWPALPHIKAYTTLRTGGLSHVPYDTFNIAAHVGDDEIRVQANRALLKSTLGYTSEPIWLDQIHSPIALPALPENIGKKADAAYTSLPQHICLVMTADCLPVLVCDREGTHVAAIHAGWRGLLYGVIENTLAAMQIPAEKVLVWLGPAIGAKVYEIGDEVRQLFVDADPNSQQAFIPSHNADHWMADLYALAKMRLQRSGIHQIYGGQFCTFTQKELFFSYRRDGNKTGRMASLIYIDR